MAESFSAIKLMKIYSLIIAMIFGAALASPGTVLVSDHFDNNTIAGSGVGNTMTLNDGWDVVLTGTASSNLTSVGTGFSTATGSMVGADDVFSRGFSFTFTPGDSYHLASLRVKAGHASGGGQNRSATSDLSVTISNGGTNIFTQAVSYTNPNGQFVNVFFAPGVTTPLDSATQYTVTVLASNTTSGGPVYDFVELQADPVRDLTYTALPRDLQVVPRDRATDTAVVPISGEVVVGTPEEIILRVYRDDVLSSETSQALVYVDGAAPFLFAPVIAAELNNYDFEVFLVDTGVETSVTRVEDVVAGDVFIIQGQSNADAQMYNGSASENENPFLRSFGLNSEDGTITEFDLSWRTAKGDGSRDVEGGVGQWGLRMGRLFVDTHNIPIAILNGARGATAIGYFQRNDADAADRTTNYGRLLYRAQMAGVTNAVRAILWYQGESDNGDGATHETGFIALSDDWRVDYPQVERIYIHQLHVGCGVTKEEVDLRDRQRRLPDTFPDMSVMSTTGNFGHEGCHYAYETGYKVIGNHIAALVGVDLYGSTTTANTTAPNFQHMYFSQPGFDEITIVMREPGDMLVFDAAAVTDFILQGSTGVTVTGGTITANNTIVLSLSGDASLAEGLKYTGGAWVTNAAGIGLLAFTNDVIYASAEDVLASQAALYQSNFDTAVDLAATGLASVGAASDDWTLNMTYDRAEFADGDDVVNSRAVLSSTNTFQSTEGFTLNVTFLQAQTGINSFSIGLVTADYGPAVYPWLNKAALGAYGIGFTTAGQATVNHGGPGLIFNDGSTADKNYTSLDYLSTSQTYAPSGIEQTLSLTVTATDWSYSLNGAPPTTGTHTFDTTKHYRFTTYVQGDNTNADDVDGTYISNITVTAVAPAPSLPVIASYDFNDATPANQLKDTAHSADVNASDFAFGGGLINSMTNGTGAYNYDGVTDQYSIFGGIGDLGFSTAEPTTLATAISEDDYLEFSITPEVGQTLDLGVLSWRQWAMHSSRSADDWDIFISYDGFASAPLVGDAFATGSANLGGSFQQEGGYQFWNAQSVDLSGEATLSADDTLTVRLYMHGRINANDSNTDTGFDEFSLTGTVAEATPSFDSWATTNGIDGELPGDDFDFDGMTNLMEYALGQDPTASDVPADTLDGITVTYTKGADAIANGDVDYIIQESDDLGVTDPWTAVVTQAAPDASLTISYTLPTPDSTNQPKVFVRLNIVEAP